MSTENKNLESGAVGKPGESTTKKADTLTSAGISSLLQSEFAGDTAEAGKEIPPADAGENIHANEGGKTEDRNPKTEDRRPKAEGAEGAEGGEGQAGEGEEGQGQGEEQGEEQGEALPAEMQSALEAWEAKGGPLPEPLQKVVNKRIGRLTADKEAALQQVAAVQAALATAKAEAEALRNDPNRPAQASPFGVPNEQDLVKQEKAAKQFLTEAEAFLDDAATPEERARVERFMTSNGLDANGLKRRVREVNGFLRDELPGQRAQVQQFRTKEAEFSKQAEEHFPWLKDAAAPEQQLVAQMDKVMPDLARRFPEHKLVKAIYALGFAEYQKRLNAGGNAPAPAARAKTPPPKAPTGGAAAPAASRSRKDPTEEASARMTARPTRENAAALALAALREA